MLDHLNAKMIDFISRQEMVFIATADGAGECDCSFRAGPAGFVHLIDERTLAYPEYRGNGVMASLGNISENAHIGMFFGDFFTHRIGLHVNGTAAVVEDAELRSRYPRIPEPDIPGRQARVWVRIGVEEAYIHCAKHLPRLKKVPRERAWGTDDVRAKGGDFFGAKDEPR
jgi:predicted pyridoxine 5'-phosphate oxidase superfamily flavin-nucleotide-binding protein